jgi:glycosyltransferase involved in cell wall biosynthesis
VSVHGMLRVKNEARWIERVIRSIQPVCDSVFVLDDHSTDETPEICQKLGCIVFDSTAKDIQESADKDFLLRQVWAFGSKVGDHCLMVDGDEALHQDDIPALKQAMDRGVVCGNMHIVYLWDREDQVRVDRWYREFRRPSLFKLTDRNLRFQRTDAGGNLHCSSAPAQLLNQQTPLPVRLLHFGYLHREDRVRKYHWYNQVDPGNMFEDQYRHVCQGDIPEIPASAALRWAGPLELRPLNA